MVKKQFCISCFEEEQLRGRHGKRGLCPTNTSFDDVTGVSYLESRKANVKKYSTFIVVGTPNSHADI